MYIVVFRSNYKYEQYCWWLCTLSYFSRDLLQANPTYSITPTVLIDLLITSATPSVNHLICQTLREINISFFNQSISHSPHSAAASSVSHFTPTGHLIRWPFHRPVTTTVCMRIQQIDTSSISIFTWPITSPASLFTHRSPNSPTSYLIQQPLHRLVTLLASHLSATNVFHKQIFSTQL